MLHVRPQDQPVSTADIVVVARTRLFRDLIQSVLQSHGHTVIGSCELDQVVTGLDLGSSPKLFMVCGYGQEHWIELSFSIRQSRLRTPSAKWIVIGPGADSMLLRAAFEAGADGLLHDDSPAEVLLSLTSLVLLGYSFIPTPMALALTEASAQGPKRNWPDLDTLPLWDDEGDASRIQVELLGVNAPKRRGNAAATTRVRFNLPRKEREILHCLVLGQSNKQIAERCNMTVLQVKLHVRTLYRKMKVSNRTQAAIEGLRYWTPRPGQKIN